MTRTTPAYPRHAAAPILRTPRLVLRGMRVSDLERFHEIRCDEDVSRHVGGVPKTKQDVWMRILRTLGHWQALGCGYWTVCRAEDGRVVGELGVGHFERGLGPQFDPYPESGWVMARETWGQGLATEAMEVVHRWYEENFGLARFVCAIEEGNHASFRVAEKLGYARFGIGDIADTPCALLARG